MKTSLSPRRSMRIAAAAFVFAVLGGAVAESHAEGTVVRLRFGTADRVVGSGRPAAEARAVAGFRAIAARGPVALVLRQGAHEGVELRGDDNLLALIETRVVDHRGVPTLEIGPKPGAVYSSANPVVATVDLQTLAALSVSGSGTVRGEALKAADLRIEVSGSGDVRLGALAVDALAVVVSGSGEVRLGGRATRLALSISGSGDVDAGALRADDVEVGIAGSGEAAVDARGTLAVSIAGSGEVRYAGDPRVTSSIAGSGRLRRR